MDVVKVAGENLEVEELRWEVVRVLGRLGVKSQDVGKTSESPSVGENGKEPSDGQEARGQIWATEWTRLKAKIDGVGSQGSKKDLNHLTYLHLIDLAFLLQPFKPEYVDLTAETFVALAEELGASSRSPLLARLELTRRQKERGPESEKSKGEQSELSGFSFSLMILSKRAEPEP